ncbi:DUF2860 family protein [Vibrio gigantis]|uniref:DUF2860 family protein n=1 Tax=Vibrio gigantis TaxID=296199 RepID=UPI001BFE041E|nr:DUF2860 family protein [Vibrio gigantis]
MKKSKLTLALLVAACTAPLIAQAGTFNTIPDESGFDGFILVGGTVTNFSSNIIAGNSLTRVNHNSTNSLDQSPDSENGTSAVFTGEINYTFADHDLQVFFGNELENVLRYDLAMKLGARRDLNGNGVASFALITSGALPTHVYADPFNVDKSEETDRDMKGIQIGWDNILDKNINLELTHKEVEIDHDNSGAALVEEGLLTTNQQGLLKRDGSIQTLKVSYSYALSPTQHFEPELVFEKTDKDGDALNYDRYGASLSYLYIHGRFSLVGQVVYSHSEYEEINPVWNMDDEGDNNAAAASLVLTYANPFGWKDTSAVTSLAYANENSNIDFYDAHIATASVGLLYKF